MAKTASKTAVKAQEAAPVVKIGDVTLKTTKEVESAKPELKPVEKKAETKTTAKKSETKTAAKKTTAKEELKPELFIQFAGSEVLIDGLVEQAKKAYVDEGHRVSSIKSLQVYFKPEENAAYYVINDKITGQLDLF